MKKSTCLLLLVFAAGLFLETAAQKPLVFRDTTIKGSQTFAIIMGISSYKYVRPLSYADKDAELFRDFLKSPGGGSLKDDNIYCLLNEDAVSANFWTKGFQWLRAKELQKGDKLFIYLAGHGDAIDQDEFFFLSYDCNPAGDKNNYLVGGAIQLYNLKKKIANETAKGVEVYFIMDACRSNELPGGAQGQTFLNNAISEKKVGEIMMLATAAGEESLEDASIGNGHGLFTWYLVDGLSGLADAENNPDNKITFGELKAYVDKNVPSVARQRFKKKQDPYFCCNENNSKVVSTIDPAYLQKWLQKKKAESHGGSNSFNGIINRTIHQPAADTALVETYNNFYKAVKSKNLTGNNSAEFYFQQLNKKFPGNPYTLDAKSTLAAEYINYAQARVDEYLVCTEPSAKQKQESYEAGLRLEKAINIIQEDDPDFARALMGRMYLLKTNNDNTDKSMAFQNAYAALAIDPNGAYICNRLALLYKENNQLDSARYYANKATKLAPNWLCALNTLALLQKTTEPKTENKPKEISKVPPPKKNSFGIVTGSGVSQAKPTYAGTRNSDIIGINPKNIVKLDLGVIYQVGISKNISIRPSTLLTFEGGDLQYQHRALTGGPITTETISLKNIAANISLPLIIRFTDKKINPFIMLGPTFSYIFKQDKTAEALVPLKKSVVLGDAGLGVDIGLLKSHVILSPELKFSTGFTDMKQDAATVYTNTLSSLKKQTITFSLCLRGR